VDRFAEVSDPSAPNPEPASETPASPDETTTAGASGVADDRGGAPEGQEILVVSLDKPSRASELLLALNNLSGEGKVRMHDAVIVAKDDKGRSRTVQTVDVTPARGALAGSWWGALAGLLIGGPVFLAGMVGGAAAGALYGKLVDHGLDDDWVKQMAEWVESGRSALLLLVDTGFDHAVVTELARFEGIGHLSYTTLPAAARAEVERALAGTTDA
jgi:uncharacterized membrane protein